AVGPSALPQRLWSLRVPLVIRHESSSSPSPSTSSPPIVDAGVASPQQRWQREQVFVVSVPRFGYLAQLLPRLAAFFGPDRPCSSFRHEDVTLRNLHVGLLVDLYQPSLPWQLTVGDGESWDIGDTFLNGVKEVRH